MKTKPPLQSTPPLALARTSLLCLMLGVSSASQAIDFGPNGMFSLTGFGELDVTAQGSYCLNCQVADNGVSKHIRAADAIIPGKSTRTVTTTFWQFQPFLGAKYKLPGGFEVSALLSQRWRDSTVNGNNVEQRYGGKVDVPGYWYDKSIALSQEDYGSVRLGSMTTRSWAVADYPYGTNLGLAEAWASSGAGYGMLKNAVRLGSRKFDVAGGDLFLEFTHDRGNRDFKRLKPSLNEVYGQYHNGDLVVDGVFQMGTNGGAGAWGHAPFSGVTPFPEDDSFVSKETGSSFGGNKQNVTMVMARYQVNPKIEVSGGIRRNYWRGANVVYNPATNWTSVFNVDYTDPFAASNPGYAAVSVDAMAGLRYRMDKWTFSTAMVYLGKADTNNPSERGQSNAALINTFGAKYQYNKELQLQTTLGVVNYAKLGLSPMSMPGNSSFTNVDSRVAKRGAWLTVGMVYTF